MLADPAPLQSHIPIKISREISFSIEVIAKTAPTEYIYQHLGTVYLNESKSIDISDDCFPLDEYSEIVKADYPYNDTPNADFEVKRDGNTLTFSGLSEGQRSLQFYHKVYGWKNVPITIAPKPDVADIQTPGSGMVVPSGSEISLYNLLYYGSITGIGANQYKDYILTSSDENIITTSDDKIYGNTKNSGKATITFSNKDFEDVKFDFVVNVKKGINESVMAILPDYVNRDICRRA